MWRGPNVSSHIRADLLKSRGHIWFHYPLGNPLLYAIHCLVATNGLSSGEREQKFVHFRRVALHKFGYTIGQCYSTFSPVTEGRSPSAGNSTKLAVLGNKPSPLMVTVVKVSDLGLAIISLSLWLSPCQPFACSTLIDYGGQQSSTSESIIFHNIT